MTLHTGDCIEVMAGMPAESVDAIVTDPPYDLTNRTPDVKSCESCGRVLGGSDGKPDRCPRCGGPLSYQRSVQGRGFMGKTWDGTGIAFRVETWREAFRVAKPGAHLLAFGGTRTYHRLASAIEDAGWEIRDCLVYAYASGFPKAWNVSKQPGMCHCGTVSATQHELRPMRDADVSEAIEAEGGEGSVLFPSLSLEGRAADSDASRRLPLGEEPGLEGRGDLLQDARQLHRGEVHPGAGVGEADGQGGRLHHGTSGDRGDSSGSAAAEDGSGESHRPQSGEQRPAESGALADERRPQAWGGWPLCDRCGQPKVDGWATAMKPAWEPIVMARKPLRGTVAGNVTQYGTGALNIGATRIGTTRDTPASLSSNKAPNGIYSRDYPGIADDLNPNIGRWPANLILTADDEGRAIFDGGVPGVVGGGTTNGAHGGHGDFRQHTWMSETTPQEIERDSGGSYSRFFLIAKSSRADREPVVRGQLERTVINTATPPGSPGSHSPRAGAGRNGPRENAHPTVKPVELMRHLVRLVTPPGGTVLDCFAGSGSTLIAAELEGFAWIGIEKEPEYVAIAEARLHGTQRGLGLDVGAPTRKRADAKPKAERVGKRGGSAWHGQKGIGSPDKEGRWPADPGGSMSRFFLLPRDEPEDAAWLRELYRANEEGIRLMEDESERGASPEVRRSVAALLRSANEHFLAEAGLWSDEVGER